MKGSLVGNLWAAQVLIGALSLGGMRLGMTSDRTKSSVRWQNRSSQLYMFSAANYGKPFSKVSVLQGVN